MSRSPAHLGRVCWMEWRSGHWSWSGGCHNQSRTVRKIHGHCSPNYFPVSIRKASAPVGCTYISVWFIQFTKNTNVYSSFSVKDGVFRQYRGARDKDSFISFVEDKKWTQVEEISSWKDPSSVQMTMVSYFFKLSMVLRNVHTTLTEDYQVTNNQKCFFLS